MHVNMGAALANMARTPSAAAGLLLFLAFPLRKRALALGKPLLLLQKVCEAEVGWLGSTVFTGGVFGSSLFLVLILPLFDGAGPLRLQGSWQVSSHGGHEFVSALILLELLLWHV